MTREEFDSLKRGDEIFHYHYGRSFVLDLRNDEYIYAEQNLDSGTLNFLAQYWEFELCPIKKFSNKLESIINE